MATQICEKCGNPPNTVQVTGMERGVITRIGLCCPCDNLHDVDPTDVSMISEAIDKKELAWAAGFFDGEGNVTFGSKPYHRKDGSVFKGVIAQIAQAGGIDEPPQVLTRFRNAVGRGTIMGPYIQKRPNHSPMWRYQACGYKDTKAVIDLLWDFLGDIKRDQANSKLEAWLAQPRYSTNGKGAI